MEIKPWKSLFKGGSLKENISFKEFEMTKGSYDSNKGFSKGGEKPARTGVKGGTKEIAQPKGYQPDFKKGGKVERPAVKSSSAVSKDVVGARNTSTGGDKVKRHGNESSMEAKSGEVKKGWKGMNHDGQYPKVESKSPGMKRYQSILKEEHAEEYDMKEETPEFDADSGDLGVGVETDEGMEPMNDEGEQMPSEESGSEESMLMDMEPEARKEMFMAMSKEDRDALMAELEEVEESGEEETSGEEGSEEETAEESPEESEESEEE